MRRALLTAAVFLTDQCAGDPEWFPHPVRLMGAAVQAGERLLRSEEQSDREQLILGAALAGSLVAASYLLARAAIGRGRRCSRLCGWSTEIVLGWTCLAARNLRDEAQAVEAALTAGNLGRARSRVARIVGRDTQQLEAGEISRAVIETLAESACDGIVAPLFYLCLGGVPLAMAYKAVNTLDSMIGHADERYFYFGKAAARVDDVANFIPARLTALAIVAAAWLCGAGDVRSAGRVWLRDGGKHASPNAGQPESAIAGALQVRLGGGNVYDGRWVPAETMGAEFPPPQRGDIRRAIRLISTAALLAATGGILCGALPGPLPGPGRRRG